MKIVLPLVHLDNLVFTPLPQLLLKQQLVLDGVCAPEDVVILEFSREDDLAASFSAIIEQKPNIVGFSSYVWNHRAVRQMSRALKDYLGDRVKVVWGGPHVSEKPRWFAQTNADCCDYVIGWYGELSFSQLVKSLQQGQADPAHIPAYTASHDASCAKAPEFDELPLPYREEWLTEDMKQRIKDRVFLLETYRNCPFACEYCFVAGTLVETASGPRPIEVIQDGDVVQTSEGFRRVLCSGMTGMSPPDNIICVAFFNGSHLVGTKNHPIWTENRGWVELGKIDGKDQYKYLPDREPLEYPIFRDKDAHVPVYNLEVEDTPEFFANGILVHNCLWGKASNKIEGKPFDAVMADFDHLLSLGMKHLKFADAGLGVVKKDNRDKRIWRTLADMDLHKRGINLRTYFFWQVIDDEWAEIFAKLISQGVIGTMDLGIQTFNPKALTDMKRPTDYDRFNRVVKILQRHRIPYAIDLILGLPGDDLEGFRHSVRTCIDHEPKRFQSFLCSVLPGAGYDLRRDELGIKTIAGSLMDDDEKVVETKTFPREDVQKALDLEAWLYFVFSLQVCDAAVRKAVEDSDVHPLAAVESLKSWCLKKAPQVSHAISLYRKNLYDSRQKGRVQCDEYMASHFKDIYLELMEWASLMGVEEEMRDGLLKFPKTRDVARELGKLDGPDGLVSSHWDGYGSLRQCDSPYEYQWKADPIMGVIGTKYAFWTWDKVKVGEEVPCG